MITPFWASYLIEVYTESRNSPNWHLIHDAHDEEDQRYFAMLDTERDKGRIAVDPR